MISLSLRHFPKNSEPSRGGPTRSAPARFATRTQQNPIETHAAFESDETCLCRLIICAPKASHRDEIRCRWRRAQPCHGKRAPDPTPPRAGAKLGTMQRGMTASLACFAARRKSETGRPKFQDNAFFKAGPDDSHGPKRKGSPLQFGRANSTAARAGARPPDHLQRAHRLAQQHIEPAQSGDGRRHQDDEEYQG